MWVPGRRRAADTMAGRGLGRQAQHGRAEGHLGVTAQGALTAADGPAHDDGHAGLTLQAGHAPAAVLGPDLDPVDQALDGGQGDAALAQRRQDVLDVAQEQGVGPDHEHALALEGEAVRIEKVGGPVQGHRRLARPRAALDDHDAGQRGADDLVLLPLDGGDDVAHVAGPGPLEGGQERAGAPELELAVPVLGRRVAVAGPVAAPAPAVPGRAPSTAGEAAKRSSSMPTMRRPWAARWRRRTRPMGSRPVAR